MLFPVLPLLHKYSSLQTKLRKLIISRFLSNAKRKVSNYYFACALYRVHVDNRRLPWVSNANPEWMVSVQEKYDLGGTLDTKSTYAGNKGQNINGVEIHMCHIRRVGRLPFGH